MVTLTQASCLLTAMLSCLLPSLCASTPIASTWMPAKARHVRDTRLIPNDRFKPLSPGIGNQQAAQELPQSTPSLGRNHAPVVVNVTNLDQSSTAEVQNTLNVLQPIGSRNVQRGPVDYDYDENDDEPTQAGGYRSQFAAVPPSGRSRYPSRFNSRFRTPTGPYVDSHLSSFDHGSPIGGSSSFGGTRRIGPSHTMPLMLDDFGYQSSYGPSRPSNLFPYPTGGLGGGSSDNFYRSESYSYSSDGMGAPRIEQNVFDSRRGFGVSSKNF